MILASQQLFPLLMLTFPYLGVIYLLLQEVMVAAVDRSPAASSKKTFIHQESLSALSPGFPPSSEFLLSTDKVDEDTLAVKLFDFELVTASVATCLQILARTVTEVAVAREKPAEPDQLLYLVSSPVSFFE
ncbi:unnamed protein product [Dibothriocephalus latus]|uniref:Uncharacterized protein n=1 Tax=Dibothriocephalus latus TaxID=60516 RepID=A0A3P7NGA8_DIBLA|nr:unnamed protein product [Dibothriocephalus latus]